MRVLKREIEVVEELSEVEPDCKCEQPVLKRQITFTHIHRVLGITLSLQTTFT